MTQQADAPGTKIEGAYSSVIPSGTSKQQLRVTPKVSTGTLSARATLRENGKSLAEGKASSPIRFASFETGKVPTSVRKKDAWTELNFSLKNVSDISYPAVTVRVDETCTGSNVTRCAKGEADLDSVYRLQWRNGTKWTDVQSSVTGWGEGSDRTVSSIPVISTLPLPANKTRNIRLRIALTSALSVAKAKGSVNVIAHDGKTASDGAGAFVGTGTEFDIG
ncbi:hypothetical protein [Streptomyces sp. NBC_00859]|uniref:hypothetical protein n=1 Tax=Streptomyces sp. NBC_00859 TaxID=2903682 RepID=UPI003869DF37|nr:hypothetical protein OG584_25575 [Streptomyces sp. NBC_00859]